MTFGKRVLRFGDRYTLRASTSEPHDARTTHARCVCTIYSRRAVHLALFQERSRIVLVEAVISGRTGRAVRRRMLEHARATPPGTRPQPVPDPDTRLRPVSGFSSALHPSLSPYTGRLSVSTLAPR